MKVIKDTATSIILARFTWLFMFIVLIASPLFPGKGTYGFYTVEWSFFFFAFFFMIFIFMTWGLGEFTPTWDRFYTLILIYWIMGLFSLADTASRLRGLLFWGQYIPYFFIFILCVSLIRSENSLDNFITKLTYLSFFFCLIVLIGFGIYRERGALNDFLINNFEISINKILTYIELPFCIVIYRMMTGYKSKLYILLFIMGLISLVISGSRGSLLMLVGIMGLAVLKSNKFGKAFLVSIFSLLIILAALLVTPYTSERFDKLFSATESLGERNAESLSRLYTGLVAFQMMIANPINGVGMGNLSQYSEIALKKVVVPPEVQRYWEKKNLYETTCTPLKMGAEIGFFGIIFFLAFYFTLWRRIKIAQKNKRGKALQTLKGLEIYIIAAFVHNFVDLGFYQYYSWVFYGVVLAATRIYNPGIIRNNR